MHSKRLLHRVGKFERIQSHWWQGWDWNYCQPLDEVISLSASLYTETWSVGESDLLHRKRSLQAASQGPVTTWSLTLGTKKEWLPSFLISELSKVSLPPARGWMYNLQRIPINGVRLTASALKKPCTGCYTSRLFPRDTLRKVISLSP